MNISTTLSSDEKVMFEEGASHFHNFIAVGGNLKLTNKRIIFKSCATLNYQHEISILLDQVSGVEFFKTLFMNPNGLAVLMKDGQMENFIVDDKKIWKEHILSRIAQSV
jgi:hypothetical protein